jgi:hypothetical protein
MARRPGCGLTALATSIEGTVPLEFIKRLRHDPHPGDVFCLKPMGRGFFFGRLIATDATASPWKDAWSGANLVYLYSVEFANPSPPAKLTPKQLLVPPFLTTNEPWKRGQFLHLEQRPITPEDRLPHHCFEYEVKKPVEYYDGFGQRITARIEPCGKLGLTLMPGIERAVDEALCGRMP